jgi:hypothetical protein
MKKIIATLTVIVAAALGAQGQTYEIPLSGSVNLTNLTFQTATATPATNYNRARLLFGISSLPDGVTVTISGIRLFGQGITDTNGLAITTTTVNAAIDPLDPVYTFTPLAFLNTTVGSYNSTNNRVNFTVTINGGSLNYLTDLQYGLQYYQSSLNTTTTFGTASLVAVPEPSAYVAAAGLVALCLWSARRRLFKAAVASSTLSGDSVNGAA